MKTEIKRQWVDALRSGEYEQGQGWLNRYDGFCCLGVLCDLAVKAGVAKAADNGSHLRYTSIDDDSLNGGSTTVLPQVVVEWAGVDDMHGRDDLLLAHKNDTGYTFSEIADIIEKEL